MIDDDKKKEIIGLKDSGITVRAISEKLKISKGSIQNVLKHNLVQDNLVQEIVPKQEELVQEISTIKPPEDIKIKGQPTSLCKCCNKRLPVYSPTEDAPDGIEYIRKGIHYVPCGSTAIRKGFESIKI